MRFPFEVEVFKCGNPSKYEESEGYLGDNYNLLSFRTTSSLDRRYACSSMCTGTQDCSKETGKLKDSGTKAFKFHNNDLSAFSKISTNNVNGSKLYLLIFLGLLLDF
ncbi:uncharacterized protein LOC128281527 [Gossypium arboreum]|uniref:uncharacterized protein LOC128281527 n=1 Tax=Gossypium arboreum TaxID=29729 RepID=UPI0022F1B4BA|nr:uncharacterized protein LOC128281527 [Gossypium arboreum]